MSAYTDFSFVYDEFMDNIPYDEWCEYLLSIVNDYKIDNKITLDLGCGTGNITMRLAREGFDMIGVDNSWEMLDIAREKAADEELDILYLLQDMKEFELFGTVGLAVSICDSMNYMTSYEDMLKVLKLANNYLEPKGIFIFDLKTPYFYENEVGDSTIAEDRGDISFIWNNNYDPKTQMNEYELTIYTQEEDDLYRRIDEVHYQRGYTKEEIKDLIAQSGLELLHIYDAFTKNEANDQSKRLYVVCQEHGK